MREGQRAGSVAIIRDYAEIPAFTSEAEEASFWQTHRLSDELLDGMESPAEGALPPPRTRPIS